MIISLDLHTLHKQVLKIFGEVFFPRSLLFDVERRLPDLLRIGLLLLLFDLCSHLGHLWVQFVGVVFAVPSALPLLLFILFPLCDLLSLVPVVYFVRTVGAEPHLDERVLLLTGLDVSKVDLPGPAAGTGCNKFEHVSKDI
jgi:hypothetical protein